MCAVAVVALLTLTVVAAVSVQTLRMLITRIGLFALVVVCLPHAQQPQQFSSSSSSCSRRSTKLIIVRNVQKTKVVFAFKTRLKCLILFAQRVLPIVKTSVCLSV